MLTNDSSARHENHPCEPREPPRLNRVFPLSEAGKPRARPRKMALIGKILLEVPDSTG